MASLVCWASGRLDVMKDKDVEVPGPVVLMTGTAGRLQSMLVAHGQYDDERKYFCVPGTQPLPDDADGNALQQQANMTLVIAFNKKLHRARLKQKGVRHVKELG